MLRASSDANDADYRLDAITGGSEAGDGNIPHGALLVELTDAACRGDGEAMEPLRRRVVEAMGKEALVDACGVIANFQRMTRVADGTGIPLDGFMMTLSSDLRSKLGLNEFRGAANSRITLGRSAIQRLLHPVLRRMLPRIARRSAR